MSATRTRTPWPRARRRARAAIAGERSQAVTSKPRRTSGMKLFPVPQATSSARLPARPWLLRQVEQQGQPALVVVVRGQAVVDGGQGVVGGSCVRGH